jgi:hypothetical protein
MMLTIFDLQPKIRTANSCPRKEWKLLRKKFKSYWVTKMGLTPWMWTKRKAYL